MSIVGDWDVVIKTPVGSLRIVYDFYLEAGELAGSAAGKHETVPCTDIVVSDEAGEQRVQWRQTVAKPMRLTLEFDVVVDGDQLLGQSRAGRLPRSTVIGTRHT